MLETGKSDVDSKDRNGMTPLSWTIKNMHKTVVKLLRQTDKVMVDSKNKNGWTSLSLAKVMQL